MASGDIYKIFVQFDQNDQEGKERYTVEIGKISVTVVLLDSITSQYHGKSEIIKQQYYPIRDWQQAGLKKESYIDIRSTMSIDFRDIMTAGTHVGTLTLEDMEELQKFIESYNHRSKAKARELASTK